MELFSSFLEFLKINKVNHIQMENNIAAIINSLFRLRLSWQYLQHYNALVYCKYLQRNVPLFYLKSYQNVASPTWIAFVIILLYFLRLFNLCPHTASKFAVMKHKSITDIFFTNNEGILLLK